MAKFDSFLSRFSLVNCTSKNPFHLLLSFLDFPDQENLLYFDILTADGPCLQLVTLLES
ncbi:hypothetical protein MXB_1257 [Myxobolus squamalis]|nr:hypothetical protein MXB_1257 [Myxobolus squamalis]